MWKVSENAGILDWTNQGITTLEEETGVLQ